VVSSGIFVIVILAEVLDFAVNDFERVSAIQTDTARADRRVDIVAAARRTEDRFRDHGVTT